MESSKKTETAAAAWLAKRDGGAWSESDAAALEAWLAASTAHRVAFLRLQAAWQQASRLKALGAGVPSGVVPAQARWQASPFFEPGLGTPGAEAPTANSQTVSTRHRRWAYSALAASLLLAALLGGAWYLWPSSPFYRTPIGGLALLPLPDGSKVTLNTDTTIEVAVTPTERDIELKAGEAFFEVAKDVKRPFVVSAGDKRVIAVGTQFSVRREGNDIQVLVMEGRVRIERADEGREEPVTQLAAGSIARTNGEGVLVDEKPLLEVEQALSWRSGFVVFHETPLVDAVAEFNRYNRRKIVIRDPRVAAIRIGGNFRSTNVDAFVRLLETGFRVQAQHTGDEIVLTAH